MITIISNGAWKVPTSAPVYQRHVRLPGAPLTTHAREQQDANPGSIHHVHGKLASIKTTGLGALGRYFGARRRKNSQ